MKMLTKLIMMEKFLCLNIVSKTGKTMKKTFDDLTEDSKKVYNFIHDLYIKNGKRPVMISYKKISAGTGLEYTYVSSALRYIIQDKLMKRENQKNKYGGCGKNLYSF